MKGSGSYVPGPFVFYFYRIHIVTVSFVFETVAFIPVTAVFGFGTVTFGFRKMALINYWVICIFLLCFRIQSPFKKLLPGHCLMVLRVVFLF